MFPLPFIQEFLIKHFYPHSSKVQNVSPERVNEQAVVRYLAQGQSAEPLQVEDKTCDILLAL